MSGMLASKSKEELFQIGESICVSHDDRWVALWAYNIHLLFRPRFRDREVWSSLDDLIRKEWDWHLGKELFNAIRQETLAAEKTAQETGEYTFLLLGEAVAKSISNGSWSPGLYDVDAPYSIPALAFDLARTLADAKLSERLHYQIMAISQHEQTKKEEANKRRLRIRR